VEKEAKKKFPMEQYTQKYVKRHETVHFDGKPPQTGTKMLSFRLETGPVRFCAKKRKGQLLGALYVLLSKRTKTTQKI